MFEQSITVGKEGKGDVFTCVGRGGLGDYKKADREGLGHPGGHTCEPPEWETEARVLAFHLWVKTPVRSYVRHSAYQVLTLQFPTTAKLQ